MSATLETETAPPRPPTLREPEPEDRSVLRTWLRMLACANIIENRIRTSLRGQFDTTLPRFDLLAQLDAAKDSPGGLTMSDLSRRLMVTNGNLTGLVERLAREGLVTRAASAPDRRTQIVTITSAGKKALDAMIPEHARWVRDMFHELSNTDRQQLYALLGKLKRSALRASERAS